MSDSGGQEQAAAASQSPLVSIIGGGAIGGLLAALLARVGRPVELVVRTSQLPAYRAGIRVASPGGAYRQPVTVRTASSATVALLVIAVKLPDLEDVCRQVSASWAKPDDGLSAMPRVLLLQNGLTALDLAARYLPASRLFAASVELGATALSPGEVTYSIPGRLLIGPAEADGLDDARGIANWLAPAVPVVVTPDIRGAQRLKFLVNLNNGVGAATGLTIQQLYAMRAGVKLSIDVMREGLAALDAAGLAPPAGRRGRGLRAALGLPDAFALAALRLARLAMRQRAPVYSSTLQSILRRRPSEIQWLNGYVVRLGQQYGVPVPLNRAVVAAVTALEAGETNAYATPAALLAARTRSPDEARAPRTGAA